MPTFLPAATFGAVGLGIVITQMLVVEDWSIVKCPDEIRALVPPLPHFGGGGKLCPDKMLLVPPLPHFFLGEIAYLTTSKLN